MDTQFSILKKIIKKKEIFIVMICLVLGFSLRFYTFDKKSLWMDEIHTYNDSRDNLKGHLRFYQENPTFLHPPLFFVLTHLFYPFPKPERDLRIIPLIFGTLSVPMIYFLSRLFCPGIALPCTLSLTFMTYHISLSQDGRSYALILFLGMGALYFLMKYLDTSKITYLLFVAATYALLFYTSYASIPFIFLSQILWFYGVHNEARKPHPFSFLILNGLTLLFCIPWILFILLNYKGESLMHPFHIEGTGSFLTILYLILYDWAPHAPLMISSIILLVLFPFFPKNKKNASILLALSILPVGGLYLFCKILNITHFVSSRYFINFLPSFLIALYLSLHSIEAKFEKLTKLLRLKFLFVALFIASNLSILPLYYRSEKQDLKGLVDYLKVHLREGDRIFDGEMGYMPGILHYFGAYPKTRHHIFSFRKDKEKGLNVEIPFIYKDKIYTLNWSSICCDQYVANGGRLWIVVGENTAKKFVKDNSFVFKGYFDGSFLNFKKFPSDASIYLFLDDPRSPEEKGIDWPMERR
jgi:hypothetical protein